MGAAEALGGLRQDVLGGGVGIGEDVGGPEADDAPAFPLQIRRSAGVSADLIVVVTAVELDPEPRRAAREVVDEGAITSWRVDAGR